MSTIDITSLPLEIHEAINLFLTYNDSTVLSLTCKSLFAVYRRKAQHAFSSRSFWHMVTTDDDAVRAKMLKRWIARNSTLPLLTHWIERTFQDACLRDEHANAVDDLGYAWDICVGCADLKLCKGGWEEGWLYEDVIHRDVCFESWMGKDFQDLEHYIVEGQLCETCSWDWEMLRTPWKLKFEHRRD